MNRKEMVRLFSAELAEIPLYRTDRPLKKVARPMNRRQFLAGVAAAPIVGLGVAPVSSLRWFDTALMPLLYAGPSVCLTQFHANMTASYREMAEMIAANIMNSEPLTRSTLHDIS